MWFIFLFARPINLREQIHDQVSIRQIVTWIAFKVEIKRLGFWIKYFKKQHLRLLIIYNLFTLQVYYEEGHWGGIFWSDNFEKSCGCPKDNI